MSKEIRVSALGAVCEADDRKLFTDAIYSILNQDFSNFEIILVVDGIQNKDFLEQLYNLEKSYSHLNLVYLKENSGLAKALNYGLNFCSSDYIMRFDADDVSIPQRMKIQYGIFESNRNLDVLGCQILCRSVNKKFMKDYPTDDKKIKSIFWLRNPIPHPGVMFRKESVIKVGGYPDFKKSQDYALWARMIQNGFIFKNHNQVLVEMNLGANFIQRRDLKYFKSEILVLKYIKECEIIGNFKYLIALCIRLIHRLKNSIYSSIYLRR